LCGAFYQIFCFILQTFVEIIEIEIVIVLIFK